jgi:hypothetical protein
MSIIFTQAVVGPFQGPKFLLLLPGASLRSPPAIKWHACDVLRRSKKEINNWSGY